MSTDHLGGRYDYGRDCLTLESFKRTISLINSTSMQNTIICNKAILLLAVNILAVLRISLHDWFNYFIFG